jgi:hypothetical protein
MHSVVYFRTVRRMAEAPHELLFTFWALSPTSSPLDMVWRFGFLIYDSHHEGE